MSQIKFTSYILLLCFSPLLFAQDAMVSGGGDGGGSGGSIGFTVGQVIYTSNSNTIGIVAQGVQQSIIIQFVTGIKEAQKVDLQCVVAPNPTSDYIKLIIVDYAIDNLNYQLFDINGKLLRQEKVVQNQTLIPMFKLKSAMYVVKIMDKQKEIKTFKVIKK